jgi:hypothetical protein
VAEVRAQLLEALEEDVEGGEVLPLDVQVLGRGEARVAREQGRVRVVDVRHEPRERTLDGTDPVHAHEVSRHLVPDGDREHLLAPRAQLYRLGDGTAACLEHTSPSPPPGLSLQAPVVVVEADEEPQPVFGRGVQHVDGRQRVRANGVEARRGHGCEVEVDAGPIREERAVATVGEAAVRRTAHAKGSRAERELLAITDDPPPQVCLRHRLPLPHNRSVTPQTRRLTGA